MGRAAAIARQISWYFGKLSWYLAKLRWYAAKLRWYAATLMGDNHYRRYLEHRMRRHPGEPVVSEREYWRMRHDVTSKSPSARCC